MAAVLITPVSGIATTGWTQVGSTVAASHVQRLDIRAANIHATDDGYINIRLNNSTNQPTRAKNYPVPCKSPNSAPDIENGLLIPAGWFVEMMASAANVVEVTLTGVDMLASDIA